MAARHDGELRLQESFNTAEADITVVVQNFSL